MTAAIKKTGTQAVVGHRIAAHPIYQQ